VKHSEEGGKHNLNMDFQCRNDIIFGESSQYRKAPVKKKILLLPGLIIFLIFCSGCGPGERDDRASENEARFKTLRDRMVRDQLVERGIADSRVISAMERVPRHKFVPADLADHAYADRQIPFGENQNLTQPYIVALMTEALQLKGDESVLEIGTGSGYQAAILATLAKKVYSIEIIEYLARLAEARLKGLGFENVEIKVGDGYRGWQSQAPFDAIIVTTAPDHIPTPLLEQLKPNGRMVIPVGKYFQELLVIIKDREGNLTEDRIIPVKFRPMQGEAEGKPR